MGKRYGFNFELRTGINHGSCVGGIIGTRKFSFDIWGDTVNVASRMESHGINEKIQVTPSVVSRVKNSVFKFSDRGVIYVKGKGNMNTYFLDGLRNDLSFV